MSFDGIVSEEELQHLRRAVERIADHLEQAPLMCGDVLTLRTTGPAGARAPLIRRCERATGHTGMHSDTGGSAWLQAVDLQQRHELAITTLNRIAELCDRMFSTPYGADFDELLGELKRLTDDYVIDPEDGVA